VAVLVVSGEGRVLASAASIKTCPASP